ncbi:YafY family transcriptional regulator [Fulvivirga sp. RKSG066]|uniref:helix-turn-helix transcriptional regulator n=1 Tax=Fulvivirga aurantia TaxID=2529383 RepID=UPI0012BB93A9|nr:YafY family protein [Fulvivirga aurantia]MTI22619.1 YafY family transcriptional regulator [Fulvivirga aurantia]
MNRIDRLSAILIQLQSKKVVKAHEIAERFDISLRTVYRDVRALEEAGVPIGAEAGVGYFLMEGYNLPPVKFSKEEAGAILMATKLAEKNTDNSIRHHLSDALFKIKAALRVEEKAYLESIDNNIEVIEVPYSVKPDFPDNFLTELQQALADYRVINFDYYSNYADSFTNRDVEPLSLCFYTNHWHLIGFCRLRQDLRDFRVDRIMKLKTKEDTFDAKAHSDYTSYLETILQRNDLEEAIIRFKPRMARFVNEQKYFMGFVESEQVDGWEQMKFMTSSNMGLAHWVIQFVDQVEVISPKSLKEEVIKLIEKGKEHHLSY